MSPTKTQVLHTYPQQVLDLIDSWKKIFAKLETRAETYRGYVDNPGGSTWEGKPPKRPGAAPGLISRRLPVPATQWTRKPSRSRTP
ncbi:MULTISPECIES: hypothetical protein [Mycobacterium]|uniref:Uncharacterized protein n=1 Tax=Mycobacterium kiyosense TaxID=2871094 RepID=A0A9P3Q7B7_9MYCO|nr:MULTISPECIES: hypothetical protein [Mycobacterium]BDB40403.1 hypothetical protein IWGMT90018_08490 [Mycobacterium kiyosense]BDE12221.1 hypothetical protein MKCMC460_10810 [Mycobacterium sp. 20KCMC460]GLB85142.1 hypothetical protein SRL2020028_43980 [Mycobacterium kiyosense]GLB91563.1 hypothetical protein SRL2020130_43800 [Mycobacterium kiyosense]GLB95106.1 hypothetical protein SRL2020226_18820 [Mycobacterium kiyosense]